MYIVARAFGCECILHFNCGRIFDGFHSEAFIENFVHGLDGSNWYERW